MAMKGNQGISSKNVVHPKVRTGSGSRGVRESGAESIGKSYGSHITNKSDTGYRGPKFHSDQVFHSGVKYGNEVALNVKGGGPGTGRTIYKTGSQCQTGTNPGNPRPQGRGILNNE
jgi:hypothetical protein